MTVSELKTLIKEVLLEAVPFEKTTDIEYGLKAKYDELEDYTFGVEFEFCISKMLTDCVDSALRVMTF